MLIVSHAWSNLLYCMKALTPGWNLPHRRLRRTVRTTDNAHCVNYLYASLEFQTAIGCQQRLIVKVDWKTSEKCTVATPSRNWLYLTSWSTCAVSELTYVNRVTSLKTKNTFSISGFLPESRLVCDGHCLGLTKLSRITQYTCHKLTNVRRHEIYRMYIYFIYPMFCSFNFIA